MKSGSLHHQLWLWAALIFLSVDPSLEQGRQNIVQQYNQGNQQQVIVPGGFQHHLLQGNFPALRALDNRNARVVPFIQNGHFQLRDPSAVQASPSVESRQRFPPSSHITAGTSPALQPHRQIVPSAGVSPQRNSGSGQDFRAGETQYEYYDDPEGDIVYHYSNEDAGEGSTGGSSQSGSGGASVSKTIVPSDSRQQSLGGRKLQPKPSQTSSFIPLVEEDEPVGQVLAFKGRSVHSQPSLRNSASVLGSNPTPLPGLLRNLSIVTKNRSVPPPPPPPVQPITKRPAVLRGPVNRFTLTSRPQLELRASPSPAPSASLASRAKDTKSDATAALGVVDKSNGHLPEEEYEEYEEGDAYYEGEEELRSKANEGKPETKTKVTVSVSTKTSSTTTPPPRVVAPKPKTTAAPGIVISVATTRSVSDRSKGFTTPPSTTPKVTFSRATGSSIVVASVQTSRSVATPSPSLSYQRLISSQHPPQKPDTPKSEPEYYEEEYTYPDSYPVLNGEAKTSSQSPVIISPSPTESIMDKLDRVQSELVNGVLSGFHSPSTTANPSATTPSHSSEVAAGVVEGSSEKQKKSLNLVAPEGNERRTLDDVKSLTVDNLFKDIKFKDLSALLPTEYRSTTPFPVASTVSAVTTTTTAKPDASSTLNSLLANIKFEEASISALLPKGYKPTFTASRENKFTTSTPASTTSTSTTNPVTTGAGIEESTEKPKINSLESLLSKVKFTDASALLPPGYEESILSTTSSSTPAPESESPKPGLEALIPNLKFDDISKFLPPGYKPPTLEGPPVTQSPPSSTTSEATTTPKSSVNKVVFPTRPGAVLKFTRPSTTEASKADTPLPPKVTIRPGLPQRKTTEFTGWPTSSTVPTPSTSSTTTESTTTTTSTTTTVAPPTTTTLPPKRSAVTICTEQFCKMEAVLKIVGFRWKPEYGDINTEEWKHMERTVKRELDAAYRSSGLAQYYRSVEIEGFTRGSIIVDYFVILENVSTNLTSADVRALFHASLPPSDQHDISQDNVAEGDKVALAADERLRLGRYIIDPKYTDFKVRNVSNEIHGASASEGIIPQWGIAVIVIGLASLMFVVIFGVTVLVNRHRNAKKKNAVSLTQEMLSEFNKTHSYGADNFGADDLYNMDDVWNDKQQPPPVGDRTFDRKPGKSRSSGKGSANYNIYDSWKTEWNGYYYNGNYYGDSGYAQSRRRSDYDTNF